MAASVAQLPIGTLSHKGQDIRLPAKEVIHREAVNKDFQIHGGIRTDFFAGQDLKPIEVHGVCWSDSFEERAFVNVSDSLP